MKENRQMEFNNVTYGVKEIYADDSSKTFSIKIVKFDINDEEKFNIVSDVGNINIITSGMNKDDIDSYLEEYLGNLNKQREKNYKKDSEFFSKVVDEILNKR